MTAATKTVYYFAFYLYIVALVLVFIPNLLLTVLNMPPTNEVWIRVVGVLAFAIGYYYHRNANNISFLRSTIPTRLLVFLSFTAFAALKLVSPVLIVFGAIDGLGALWTWLAIKRSATTLQETAGKS